MEYEEYERIVRENIQKELKWKNITYSNIGEGLGMDPQKIKRMIKGGRNGTELRLKLLFKICDYAKISFSDIFPPNVEHTQNKNITPSFINLKAVNKSLLFNPAHKRFENLLNHTDPKDHYYFYTKPTTVNADRLPDNLHKFLKGTVKIVPAIDEDGTSYVNATMKLYTGEKNQYGGENIKEYRGNFFLGDSTNICTMILTPENDRIEEINVVSFNYGTLYAQKLECGITTCSTISSGFGTRRPTIELGILSKYELTDDDLKNIDALIATNHSALYIRKEAIDTNPELTKYIDIENSYYKMNKSWSNIILEGKSNVCLNDIDLIPFVRLSKSDDSKLYEYIRENVIHRE